MSQISNITPVAAAIAPIEVLHALTAGMVTYDKKGNKRNFEMSLAFASKDERTRLMVGIFAKQCENGDYGNLIREVLSEGIVPKAQALVINMMLGTARRPSKATTRSFCAIIEGLVELAKANGKAPKGKKMVLINMVMELSALIGKEDTTADDANRTIDAK